MYGRPPISTLFPYPTLFRSHEKAGGPADAVRGVARERLVLEHTAAELDLRRWRRGRCGRGLRLRAARGCGALDRKSTRLNSSHSQISYAVFCLKKKK